MLSGSLQAQIDRSIQPKPGPAPTVNVGKPKSFKLDNGLEVLVVENHKLPRVSFSLSLDNPPVLEGDIAGVGALVSQMLGNGTTNISKDKFNDDLEFYGSSVNFSASGFNGSSLSKYFPQTLSLAVKGFLDPLFTESELDAERAKLLDNIKTGEKSASIIAGRVRSALVYGKNHPEGEFLTEKSINKVTLADVQSFYKANVIPTKAYLVVVGDVNFDEVKNLVTQDFSAWKKAALPLSNYNEPQNLSNIEIDFIDVPNAVQSEISVSNVVNLKMTDSDYYAAILANFILGGGGESYLFMNLRETHAWTYGSYSNLSGDKYTTDFTATAAVRNSVTDSAVVEILKEIKRIRTELPTEADLKLAKAKFIGSFVMNAEKPAVIASFALKERTQSLPADFYENYIKNVESVTLEQVQAAAHKYITDQQARIVIAGKASEVLPGLEELGIPINYYDKYANSVEKPTEKSVDANVTVTSVLQKYIDAIGGKDLLNTVDTKMVTSTGSIQGTELSVVKKDTKEGKTAHAISMMNMTMVKTVFNGKTGYAEIQGQKRNLTEEDLANIKYSTVFPELLMIESKTIKLDGIQDINGSEAYKLVDGDNAYYYDVVSGLKLAEGVKKEVPGTGSIEQFEYYQDYKALPSGIKIPYKTTMNVGMDVELNVSDVKINEGVSDADFIVE